MDTDKLDELLHDAERAFGGMIMAGFRRDHARAVESEERCDRLLRDAITLDPEMAAPAWEEIEPSVRKRAVRVATLMRSEAEDAIAAAHNAALRGAQ